MKKTVCILLCVLLLVLAVGCEPFRPEISGTNTSAGEQSVEESKEENPVDEKSLEKINAIRAILAEEPDRELKAKNLFAGLRYTSTSSPSSEYPDPDFSKLTDGVQVDVFDKQDWVGFSGSYPSITFDLGEGEHALADIAIGCLQQVSYGIHLPSRIQLQLSDDGKNFTVLTTLSAPGDAADSCKYIFRFCLPQVTHARYVKLRFNGSSEYIFLDEIMGYEYCEDGTIDVSGGETAEPDSDPDYYQYALQTEITNPVSAEDEDYDTFQNLALLEGAEVQARSFDPIPEAYYPDNSTVSELQMLIDGKTAGISYNDAAWAHFTRGAGRYIDVDLGNVMAVSEIKASFLHCKSAGIAMPAAVLIYVSEDGQKWTVMDDVFAGLYDQFTTEIYNLDSVFANEVKARYVRFSFVTQYNWESSSIVYASEFEVWGKKNTAAAVDAETPAGLVGGSYVDPQVSGCENMVYGCTGSIDSGFSFTEENGLCYFAYLDRDGNIKDTFMDAVTIGGHRSLRAKADEKDNVLERVNSYFAEGYNIDAVEKIAAKIEEALGREVKIVVYLDLDCPNVDLHCSDIDGDGKEEDFRSINDCVDFVKWQIDTYLEEYAKHEYPHLELGGVYWNNECIHKESYDLEKNVIKKVTDYVHEKGYKIYWHPYYGAYGQWAWNEVGLDYACLQPNYMFYATEKSRLTTTAEIAKTLGMSVEIEIEDANGEETVRMYREYLRAGYDCGYMNAVKVYYQSSVPGAFHAACYGETELARSVYDDTYLFAKGLLDETYNVGRAVDMSAFTDQTVSAETAKKVELSVGDTTGCDIRFVMSPVFGNVRLDNNGTLIYSSYKEFVGTERIAIEISDKAGNNKVVYLFIEVDK